jgi:hypothetical protein
MDARTHLPDVVRSVDALNAAQAEAAAALRRVEEVALPALEAARDADDGALADIVAALYWNALDLPVRRIARVVGSDDAVRSLAGPGPVLPPCVTCGGSRRARNRTELKAAAAECSSCTAERERREMAERQRAYQEESDRRELEEWRAHVRDWHAVDTDDEVEAARVRHLWTQLPRWSCGCGAPGYEPRHRWW